MLHIKIYLEIAKTNLRHNFLLPFAAAVGIVFLAGLLYGTTALDALETAKPLEFFLCFTGAALLTPLFLPEQEKDIRDVVLSKKVNYGIVCMIRLLYNVIAMGLLVAAFGLKLYLGECAVSWTHISGAVVTALFLGAVGLFAAGISGNVVIGFMAVILFYLANYGLKGKLGVFYLFSMSSGQLGPKWWLLFGAILLIAAGTYRQMRAG